MSFNGSGTFVINSAGQPVVANTVISATTFNALTADLANGLSTCITKDGQTTPTANIPMGGFKITNLATGTAATDAATVAQIQSNGAALVTVTGTDTLTGTLTPALVAYVTGAVYYFVAPATNTGAVTLNIDTLGAKAVTRDGTTALVAGDIVSGEMVAVVYDGTRFQLISAVNSFTNLNVSGTLTVAGATTLNGNLQVGNAAADTVNFQASGWTLTNNVSVTGTWADIGTITTADINGGTIDGTTIGGGTAAAGTFTTVGATTGNITTVNATTVDSTNLEVTNLKAKDGTAAGSIADATGVVTLNSVVATTADINGGTIDATTIGGSSPAVGNFTTVSAASAVFTTATITTVNTTTLDLTNLEVTNIKAKDGTASMTIDDATGKVNATTVSAASMNAGVAAVTSLTATGASVASANVGTAVITNGTVTALTATGASIASMNAGVALLTTATVTNLTATSASIASANVGTLALTRLDVAAVSVASANAGVAVITTGTVTNLTSTSASIASMNAGVALLTTATVTNLTATGASVASANVGTAVVTGLTVTGASIASVNAGVAVLSGNLTLNGGTANGVLYLNGSKVATSGSALTFDGTNGLGFGTGGTGNTAAVLTLKGSSATNYGAAITGTRNGSGSWFIGDAGTALGSGTLGFIYYNYTTNDPWIWYDGGASAERMRLTSTSLYTASGINVGIGTSSPSGFLANKLVIATGGTANEGMTIYSSSNNGSIWFADATTGTGRYAGGLDYSHSDDTLIFYSATQGNMRLNASGNLGLGVTPSAWSGGGVARAIQVSPYVALFSNGAGNTASALTHNAYYDGTNWKYIESSVGATRYEMTGANAGSTHSWSISAGGTAGTAISFTPAMTLDASGNLLVGTTSASGILAASGRGYIEVNGTTDSAVGFKSNGTLGGYLYNSATEFRVSNYSNNPLTFHTNNTERARITSGGYSKFSNTGTYSNSALYHEFYQTNNNTALLVRAIDSTFSESVLTVQGDRTTTNGTYYLADFYNGNVSGRFRVLDSGNAQNTNNSYAGTSDIKLKQDIVDASSQWDDIKSLRIRKYRFKHSPDAPLQIGLVAQESETVSPGLVEETIDRDEEGNDLGTTTKSVKYSVLYMKAVKALQEAMARIEQLEAKVAALESK
jgi:hypothetical protein